MSKELTVNIESIAEEIEGIVGERVKNSREELLKGHWEVGETIRRHGEPTVLVESLAARKVAGLSASTLWLCVKFNDAFPEFEKVYDLEWGMNVSWNKVRKYLGEESKEKSEPTLVQIADKLISKLGPKQALKVAELIVQRLNETK